MLFRSDGHAFHDPSALASAWRKHCARRFFQKAIIGRRSNAAARWLHASIRDRGCRCERLCVDSMRGPDLYPHRRRSDAASCLPVAGYATDFYTSTISLVASFIQDIIAVRHMAPGRPACLLFNNIAVADPAPYMRNSPWCTNHYALPRLPCCR